MIDLYSGLIIDFTVMSKYCAQCVVAKKKCRNSTKEFLAWYEKHQPVCQVNHIESSGAMKKTAAETMWSRSLSHDMLYTKMISDGDSKIKPILDRLSNEDLLNRCANCVI